MNRLCWNDAGTRLASGSDDTTVCIFDAASGKRDLQFRTGHRRNILSVKFLPCTNDQVRFFFFVFSLYVYVSFMVACMS